MILTFHNDRFIIRNCIDRIESKLILSKLWFREATPKDFSTHDPRAAVKFQALADDKARRVLTRVFVKHYEAPLAPLPDFLDPHQIEGVKWILTRSRSYLAHSPGAGKTCEAIVASQLINSPLQTLYIVPPTLTANWAREIIKWTEWTEMWPSVSIVPQTNDQEQMDWDAEYILCPDSMITRPWVLKELTSRKFKLVAVDEASRFKEAHSKRTIALFGGHFKVKDKTIKSSGIVHQGEFATLLDGSPMPNRSMELWAPTFAMAPETIDFMSRDDFGYRYCNAKMNQMGQWEFKGASKQEELKEKLQKSFMHVVTEEQLKHPERKRAMIFMTEDPRSVEQKAWEHKHLKNLNFSDIDDDMNEGDLARFRRELGLNKVPWVAKYVRERIESGESVLLFAWHREVCLRLRKALINFKPGIVFGGTLPHEREKFFDDFQNRRKPLIILNIAAGGRGHNLQRADRVVFGEFSWTDETNKQCEKRASRKGSDKISVPCDYIVAPNSLDEPVLNSVFTKAKNVKRVIG